MERALTFLESLPPVDAFCLGVLTTLVVITLLYCGTKLTCAFWEAKGRL